MAQAVTELIRVLNGPALQYLPGGWSSSVSPREIASPVLPAMGNDGAIDIRPNPQDGEGRTVRVPMAVTKAAAGLDPLAFVQGVAYGELQDVPGPLDRKRLGVRGPRPRGQHPNLAHAVVIAVEMLFHSWDKREAKELAQPL